MTTKQLSDHRTTTAELIAAIEPTKDERGHWQGAKFQRGQDVADIAKLIRADIKAAVLSGALPDCSRLRAFFKKGSGNTPAGPARAVNPLLPPQATETPGPAAFISKVLTRCNAYWHKCQREAEHWLEGQPTHYASRDGHSAKARRGPLVTRAGAPIS